MRSLTIWLLTGAIVWIASGQEAREIWDSGFRAKRPVPTEAVPPRVGPRVEYQFGSKAPASPKKAAPVIGAPVVGLTLWLARLAPRGDSDGARLLVQDVEYVFERIPTDTVLHPGQKIRLSFEAPREGFLYVVDRERYTDGGHGDPYLVFPAMTLNGGDNRVGPGRLIEVPGQMDLAKTLAITARDSRYGGEELLILLTPERQMDVRPGEREIRLSPELVEGWIRQWSAPVERLDIIGNRGRWTSGEQSAGANQRLLTQDDPMPQSIYAGASNGDRPILVRVPLEVRQ